MNPPDTTPPPKQGFSGVTIAGIGCAALAVIGLIAFGALVRTCSHKVKEVAGDFQKNPGKTAAMLAVRANPDLEIVKTDDASGEITIRNKKSGEETTMSFDAMSKGKFRMKNSKGEEVTVDATSPGKEGTVVVKNAEGETVIGGSVAATSPPAWVPAYPAAKAQAGGMKQEKKDGISGTFLSETSDAMSKVRDFYESKLKADGFTTEVTTTSTDGNESAVLSATKDDGKRKVTVMVTGEKGTTNVILSYEGAK